MMHFVQVDPERRFQDPQPGETLIHSRFRRERIAISSKAPSLKYVIAGAETYLFDGVRTTLRPGDFLFVRAGVEMTVEIDAGCETVGLCAYTDEDDAPDADAPFLFMRAPDAYAAAAADIGGRIKRGALKAAALSDGFNDIKSAGLSAARNGYAAYQRLDQAREATRRDLFARLDRARAYILDHVDRPMTLDALARHAGMSKYHFLRQFKAAYGVSPMRFFADARLDAARRRLLNASGGLEEVACAFGYSGQSAFSKAFRKRYGFSPGRLSSSGD